MNNVADRLTEQQVRAVTTRGTSVVLSAVAGCGKTRVLTERYVSHLVNDRAAVSEIVAFTFTDKAAREMRKRIRESVRRRLNNESTAHDQQWWRDQERDLETANISTIHAFCTQLLQRFAVVTGLDPGLEVLDETIAPTIRESAVREALYSLLDEQSPTGHALRDIVRWYGWAAARNGIDALLVNPSPGDWSIWLEKPNAEWIAAWFDARQHYLNMLTIDGTPIANAIQDVRETTPVGPLSAGRIPDILQAFANCSNTQEHWLGIQSLAQVKDLENHTKWPDKKVFAKFRDAMKLIRETIKDEISLVFVEPVELEMAAAFGRDFLQVALTAHEAFAAEKRNRGVIDFNDQLLMARNLLRDHKAVRTACQRQYKFLLVDELQDTDPVQMEIIELLVGSGLTNGKLFAVGDANQSIYRFRGADVSLFTQLRQKMSDDGKQSLTVNYRSQPAILHFVNALLCRDIPQYEALAAHVRQVTVGPCVEFLWTPVPEKTNATTQRQFEAAAIARRIKSMVDGKEPIATDRNQAPIVARPVRQCDIVLLFRAMSNVGIYEKALRDAGLDYYVVGGRAFYAQQEIYDVLNLLQAIGNPLDSLALASVLRSPFACVSDEGLYRLTRNEHGLWAALSDAKGREALSPEDNASATRFANWMLSWRELKDRLPIARLLNRIIADSGYDAALQYEPLGDRKLANLWKLIDQARAFDAAGGFTLDDFVRKLDDLVSAQPREEQAATQPAESNVVRLMSIHQAKGLEFPVVFLPDFTGKTGAHFENVAVWDSAFGCAVNPPNEEPEPFPKFARMLLRDREKIADAAEELRVLYVACTRAADYLVVSGATEDPPKEQNERTRVLMRRFDIETGECRDETIASHERPMVRVTSTQSQFGR